MLATGYGSSGDSRAVLQLVWNALRDLPPEQRRKPIHVIATDMLVEQPMVAAWVDTSQARMREAAQALGLLITPQEKGSEADAALCCRPDIVDEQARKGTFFGVDPQ